MDGMRRRAHTLLSCVFALTVWTAAALGGPGDAGQAPPEGAEKRQQWLEHWRSLPPEKKERLRKLYETLRELPPDERRRLIERFRSMDEGQRTQAVEQARKDSARDSVERDVERERRELIRRQFERLPPEEKERLKRMPSAERGRALREKMEERESKLLSRLPPGLREKAEKLPPHEQTRFLLRLRRERLCRRTFQDEEENGRLRAMPHRTVAEALDKGARKDPPEKPEFISDATWQRWLALRPFERPAALRQLLWSAPGRDREPHRRPPGPSPPRPPEGTQGRDR